MIDLVNAVSARDIAVSGLRAQRMRMNIIANNIANAFTTRTPEGGAFRRQMAVFAGTEIRTGAQSEDLGVRVRQVISDPAPLRQAYEPSHPDADADGMVYYPNISLSAEMVDLVAAQRGYEANLAVMSANTRMNERVQDMLQQV
ncbi:MAG: flagellar basal body rod protein FlgC [Candidatus Hydrogenedentes bacterium]|nr:flagellar basal body rod protein FlgC [Candidatus Hydrogenedentota bacterium]